MKCYHGRILSVNEKNEVFRWLVEDGGVIRYVGNELPEQYRECEQVELGNRALIPAFVDTHQHFASFSIFQAGLNVMDAESNEEILRMVADFAKRSTEKTLIAFGASPYSVREKRLPAAGISAVHECQGRAEPEAAAHRRMLRLRAGRLLRLA